MEDKIDLKISISTASLFGYPLRTTLGLVRCAGFDGIELVVTPEVALRQPKRIARICMANNVRPLSVHIPMGPRLPGWRRPMDARRRTAEVAAAVRTGIVVLHNGYDAPPGSEYQRRFLQSLEIARGAIDPAMTQLTIENNDWHLSPQSDRTFERELEQLARFADTEKKGITFDTSHVGGSPERIFHAWNVLRPWIVNVHCNNIHRGRSHQTPDKGYLPLRAFLVQLQRDNYDGIVTLEPDPRVLAAWWPPTAVARLARSREFCLQAMGTDRSEIAKRNASYDVERQVAGSASRTAGCRTVQP